MSDKRNVTVVSEMHDIDGNTLQDAIDTLESLKEHYTEYSKINFCTRWDGDTDFEVLQIRLETDEEYEVRKSKETHQQTREKDYRRQQYEALKKEFGE